MKHMNQARLIATGGTANAKSTPHGDGDGDIGPTAEEFAALQAQIATMTDNVAAITEERDTLKAKHTEAEKHRLAAEKAAKKELEDAMRKSGDVAALEASWQEKLDATESARSTEVASLQAIIQDVTVGAASATMASELAVDGSASVLEPHIRSRLGMELRDGKPHISVMENGKPTAKTLDDLKAEISGNDAFAPILKGSGASGGGTGGQGGKGGGGGKTMKRSAFDQLPVAQQAHFIRVEKGVVVD